MTDQVNYKQTLLDAPKYAYQRVQMNNIQSDAVTVSADNSVEAHFKLPSTSVFNLSRSKISCSVTLPAATAANQVTRMLTETWPFQGRVSLETGNGIELLRLNYSTKFNKIVSKVETSVSEFLTHDNDRCLAPCDSATNRTFANSATDAIPYREPKYYSESDAKAPQTVTLNFPLSDFKNTILSLDKDIYFGVHDMYLKINIDGYNTWAYEVKDDHTGVVTLTAPVTQVQNFYLWLAEEQNPSLVSQVKNRVDSGAGLKFLIDFPIIQRAVGSNNVKFTYLPSNGKTLKRVYHTLYNVAETLSTSVDCSNVAAAKLGLYNTYVDSRKLQNYQLSCSEPNNSSWRFNEPFIQDSVYFNKKMFMKNWFHCDCFEYVGKQPKDAEVPDENVLDGLSMTTSMDYQFEGTLANGGSLANIQHYNFAIFQRTVLIDKNGVQFV